MSTFNQVNIKEYNKQVRKIAVWGALKSFALSLALDIIGSKMIPATLASSFLIQAAFSYIIDVRIIKQSGLDVYKVKYDMFGDHINAAKSAATSELIRVFISQQKFKLFSNVIPVLGAFYTALVVYRSIRRIGYMSLKDVTNE
ncbi:hypothetical protein BHU72_07575 [Desulfuribacillus stibiiarsenatis]|uniref:Uncharacterized protein n=1 Tax=Desulfuribacillus stibiiarsenatis TaxID=1390249 RepID=A0A1E5L3H6_9FIRM|nr:hypothetical protein [Desulfuribacillus stibiiarsenatis]OEH84690.1 hypothetical protein BHU72_07575 [Desulfuribacillus stibiiarsenatis]